eukprot:COSAG06_NODE_588_length_13995_cov_37.217401_5_plen_100_part_00
MPVHRNWQQLGILRDGHNGSKLLLQRVPRLVKDFDPAMPGERPVLPDGRILPTGVPVDGPRGLRGVDADGAGPVTMLAELVCRQRMLHSAGLRGELRGE